VKREEWIEKAIEQYVLHGVSNEKARLWAESILNNMPEAQNDCPYLTAEKDYRT
jgi:hypothetical protein